MLRRSGSGGAWVGDHPGLPALISPRSLNPGRSGRCRAAGGLSPGRDAAESAAGKSRCQGKFPSDQAPAVAGCGSLSKPPRFPGE